MSRKKSSAIAAVTIGALSVGAAFLISRRSGRNRPHAGLYFEDGSMVSLPDSSPQAKALIELGKEAVALV